MPKDKPDDQTRLTLTLSLIFTPTDLQEHIGDSSCQLHGCDLCSHVDGARALL